MTDRIRAIHDALVAEHGEPEPPERRDPVAALLETILSQNTSDANRDAAWADLQAAYGTDYAAIEAADHEVLADTIRTAGLAEQKAARIQRSLAAIREATGGAYRLDFLDGMDLEAAHAWLTDIDGVGDKTAGIVLLFQFEKPYVPVDTHCERLAKRFGLVAEDASIARVHEELTAAVPAEMAYSLHRLLIDHGRAYCSARAADCDNPVCREFCDCAFCPDGLT